MRGTARLIPGFAGILLLACSGCSHVSGKPSASVEAVRPDEQLDFHVLYQENCSGCHGANGRGGAAIPLNNPAYLAVAGADTLRSVTAKGLPGTLMPAFAASSGGMLTDKQVDALVQGMLHTWARPAEFSGMALPPYSVSSSGDATNGQKAYAAACARCHGAEGTGVHIASGQAQPAGASAHSIVDPSYLTLVSDQNLRSTVIAGHLDWKAPDWRSYLPGRALAPQEITDIVAWLASHRPSSGPQAKIIPNAHLPGVAEKERP